MEFIDSFTTSVVFVLLALFHILVINVLLLDYRCNKEMCVTSVISPSTVYASKPLQGLATKHGDFDSYWVGSLQLDATH